MLARMAHRTDKRSRPYRPLRHSAASVQKADGAWITRTLAAGTTEKTYTCPGCLRAVTPGTAHVVVWPALPPIGSTTTVEHRRHWHNACWSAHR